MTKPIIGIGIIGIGIIGILLAATSCSTVDKEAIFAELDAAKATEAEIIEALGDLKSEVAAGDREDKDRVLSLADKIEGVVTNVGSVRDDIAARVEAIQDPGDALATAGAVASSLPVPYAPIVGLALTTLAGFFRARQNRVAGRNIAARVEMASKMSDDGKIDLNDPKTKMVLSTMGGTATKIVREGLGQDNGLGI